MRKILVAGNWKLNGSIEDNATLLQGIVAGMPSVSCDVAVCPPYPYLERCAKALSDSGVQLGAQSVSEHDSGAFTGEISAAMLKEMGCHYVIVGHSERRALFGEDNETVARKFAAAAGGRLVPILCLGETLEEREKGVTEDVVGAQLDAVIDHVGAEAFANAVIAYEPVWAIGTGKTATSEQAQSVHAFIRARVAASAAAIAEDLRILYGGSVKPDNATELFSCDDIDGGLIGGASLKAESFLGICQAG